MDNFKGRQRILNKANLERELIKAAEQALKGSGVKNIQSALRSRRLVNHYVDFSGPKIKEALVRCHPSGKDGGQSKKLTNIGINIREVVKNPLNMVSLGYATLQQDDISILLALAAIINHIWRQELGENEVRTLISMWQAARHNLTVHRSAIAPALKMQSQKYNRPHLTPVEVDLAIKKLEGAGCIKQVNSKTWKLLERVSYKY